MKNRNFLLSFLFVFSSFASIAQELAVPTTAAPHPSINGPVATDILFIGIDNAITITAPGYDASKIVATISGDATLSSVEQGKSYIAVVRTRGEVTITLTIQTDAEPLVVNKTFTVKYIPPPYAALGTIKNGDKVDAETLKKNSAELLAVTDGAAIRGITYKIVSTVFIFVPKEGDARVVALKDGKLAEECLALLENIKPGDRIIFDQVRAEGIGGKRNLAPVVITVE